MGFPHHSHSKVLLVLGLLQWGQDKGIFVSFDLCCRGKDSTYKVVVGRSEKITGPYVDDKGIAMNEGGGKLLIEGNENWFGAGHNSVYSFDGKDYIFYHAYDAHKNGFPVGQKSELIWTNGWPSLLNPLK